MFVFISYPREFDAVAAKLDAELKSRNINRFLDREGINLGDVWKLKIESNIKKSSVFIILYLPAAATQDRFFLTETEHIKKECEKNLKKIITVIFSPTVPRDLPPFFTNHQILEARAEGFRANERDGYWIDQIVQEVERLKEIEKLDHQFKAKIKRRQIIARTALTTAGVIIAGLLYSKPPVPSSFGDRVLDGESMCNSLVGAYELHQGYVFTEGIDARSIAKNASWKASNCEYRDRNATYILKGA